MMETEDRTPLDRVSIRREVEDERIRQMRRTPYIPDGCTEQGRRDSTRDERHFALGAEYDDTRQHVPLKLPTQPRADGIQSGLFLVPLAVFAIVLLIALGAALL